jgi:hypothetical protein
MTPSERTVTVEVVARSPHHPRPLRPTWKHRYRAPRVPTLNEVLTGSETGGQDGR